MANEKHDGGLVNMLELRNTIELMNSPDYEERFAAEYWQTFVRYQKLRKTVVRYKAGTLEFELTCPISLLEDQMLAMELYIHQLEIRAEVEGIDLEAYAEKAKPPVNASKGEVLIRKGDHFEVVCADDETFVVAPRDYNLLDGTITTKYDRIEAYSNDPGICTLDELDFVRVVPEAEE